MLTFFSTRARAISAAMMLGILALMLAPNTHAAVNTTYTVNSTADSSGVCDVTECTLREAIAAANANAGADTINFNIPGAGVQTISPLSALPTITGPVTIDGYSQPGASANTLATGNDAVLLIDLNGASGSGDGLTITGGGSTVKGLVIRRFVSDGIYITTAGGNTIEGNFIGTNAGGTSDQGNTQYGIYISSAASNTIGGATPAARNLISGNDFAGIRLLDADLNLVAGNYIGTDKNGAANLGTGGTGVIVTGDADSNTIGGTTSEYRNLISSNDGYGIEISGGASSDNLVQGNFIGTDVTGTSALGNSLSGINLSLATNTTIGGTSGMTPGGACTGACNLISGNNQYGIYHGNGGSGNVVQGNFIGADVSGMNALGNAYDGIYLYQVNGGITIGGTTANHRNLISGNGNSGIYMAAQANNITVSGNFIGVKTNGTEALPNASHGILLGGYSMTIGGTTGTTPGGACTGACNLISGNGNAAGEYGIRIYGDSNTVQGNFIGANENGTGALKNYDDGIYFENGAANNTIGGTTTNHRNLISGNGGDGIEIYASGTFGNAVQGNYIGTQTDGASALGNTGHGIYVSSGAYNNDIGGTASGSGNTIAFNGGDGVFVGSTGTGNCIDPNSIFGNGGLGIDLGINGVTANDVGDPDTGANNRQNFPVITYAHVNGAGDLLITYNVDSTTGNSAYPLLVEFFEADAANGEGKTFIGSNSYASGEAQTSKAINLGNAASLGVSPGDPLTATATDANDNTSEFSATSAPTAITLLSFHARRAKDDRVLVKWETGSELDIVGFNIWRAGKRNGEFVKVNGALQAAKATGQVAGAKYSFRDKKAMPAIKYWYRLEVALASGQSEWSDAVLVRAAK